tara:strand:- start:6257 stop:8353 length:2097 start_codon:yes stop_codon:yes gene_type:complete
MMTRYPNFSWWQGVVEDRNDPEQFGRYRVRIIGYHTLDKNILPTESLPWAIPMQPVTSAAISGVGSSPTGLVEGSTVIGFFVDGEDGQIPVIMGSFGVEDNVPTIDDKDTPESPESLAERGFYDPNGKFPRRKELKISEDEGLLDKVKGMVSDGLGGVLDAEGNKLTALAEGVDEVDVGKNVLGEASSSRLARGDMSENHYSLKGKRETRIGAGEDDNGIPRGFASKISGWNNKELPYNHDNDGEEVPVSPGIYEPTYWEEPHPQGSETSKSQYPYNHVRETESGHVFEVDDTPDAERIHEYHTAGTFREIQPDGTKVEKIVGEDYVIDLSNRYMYVKGNFDLMVEGDYNINVKGNKYEHISGHSYNTVMGNRLNKIQGHELVDTESTFSIHTVGNYNVQVGATDKKKASLSNYKLRVTGDTNTTHQGPHRNFNRGGLESVTTGDANFNVMPKFGIDTKAVTQMIKDGASAAPPKIVQGGSFKVSAFRNIDLAAQPTDIPKVPKFGSSINILSDRVNTTARVDMVERIGQVGTVHASAESQIIPQVPGRKSTFAVGPLGGIYNVFSMAPIILPGALGYLVPASISDDIIGPGSILRNINNVAPYPATVGTITDNITGIGAINRTIIGAGAITDLATVGAVSYTAGGAATLAAGGAASMTAGGAATVTAGAAVAISAGAAASLSAAGAVTVTGVTIALN